MPNTSRTSPGRKTDVNDAMWIADLLAHGLIRSSFVPPAPIQERRDLTRTRKQIVREIAQQSLRIQKLLEDANIKLGNVLSNVLGASGRAMLEAIVAGESDSAKLAELAQGSARRKQGALVEALRGRITPHHRTMLKLHLDLIAALEHRLAQLDAAVGKQDVPQESGARESRALRLLGKSGWGRFIGFHSPDPIRGRPHRHRKEFLQKLPVPLPQLDFPH